MLRFLHEGLFKQYLSDFSEDVKLSHITAALKGKKIKKRDLKKMDAGDLYVINTFLFSEMIFRRQILSCNLRINGANVAKKKVH